MAAERMNDSILVSIKKMLGLPDEYDAFDLDIITHINSAVLSRLSWFEFHSVAI